MACQGCGSGWLTQRGKDCTSCPYCCRLSRCNERKRGRWDGPKGQPFLKSVFKKKRKRAKRASTQCGYCSKRLKSKQPKYCSSKCFSEARKCGKQSWDRTGQLEGCYHRGGRWNNAPSKAYVAAVGRIDAWLAKTSGLWRSMLDANAKASSPCQTCSKPLGDYGASYRGRFCSLSCAFAWTGTRHCKCGKEVAGCRATGKVCCGDCNRESRRRNRRMYGSYRRRCRTYGGYFNPQCKPVGIFVRDKWTCHICRKKCSKVFCLTDPLSATVDHHPVPLSKGGDHDWHNVRCACFACNTAKGNKWDRQRRLSLK